MTSAAGADREDLVFFSGGGRYGLEMAHGIRPEDGHAGISCTS